MRSTRRTSIAAALGLLLSLAGGLAGAGAATTVSFACEPAQPAAATPSGIAMPVAPPSDLSMFPDASGSLTVFAAASLADAFTRIGDDLEAAHPGLDITFNFAGSQSLVTQLASGARADVVALASASHATAASEEGLVAGEPVLFARNHLAVVVPAANPGSIDDARDLANDGIKVVLALPEVPAGAYARAAICAMGDRAFVDAVAANVVSEEEDVRGVLAKVELGEADAGIVYRTDALAGGDAVRAIPLPETADPAVAYPIAPVKDGDAAIAGAFIDYVRSDEGQATLADFGFEPAGA